MAKSYPISEIFFSIQGEGQQSGTPMVFVRLAGCTVGKRFPEAMYGKKVNTNLFPVWQNECTIYDGRRFPCDTDYRKKMLMTPKQIVEEAQKLSNECNWVSITGGEPLMHDLYELTDALLQSKFELHLETSGTIKSDDYLSLLESFSYVVVSPKYPFLSEYCEFADEIRLLVDEEFDWDRLPTDIVKYSNRIWISPVNPIDGINAQNAAKCVEIAKSHPEVRISLQIHKLLQVR